MVVKLSQPHSSGWLTAPLIMGNMKLNDCTNCTFNHGKRVHQLGVFMWERWTWQLSFVTETLLANYAINSIAIILGNFRIWKLLKYNNIIICEFTVGVSCFIYSLCLATSTWTRADIFYQVWVSKFRAEFHVRLEAALCPLFQSAGLVAQVVQWRFNVQTATRIVYKPEKCRYENRQNGRSKEANI